jgi:hypothetical protein
LHTDLTPGMTHKFLGLVLAGAFVVATGPAAVAQTTDLSSYQGPGILSRGVGDLGSRSGEQLDLRVYGGVSGVFDDNIQPLELDSQGNLIKVHNLYGVEATFGAYGVHNWLHSQLGLEYRGTYRHYTNTSLYGGSDDALTLGYTHQASRRLVFDLRESVGTVSLGNSPVAATAADNTGIAFTPTTLLFDSRTNYLQSSANMTWIQSARTSFTIGGDGFLQDRKSEGLTNAWGYDFSGSVVRRMSRNTSLGVSYAYSHFEFPGYVSSSNAHTVHGTYAALLGRFWKLSVEAGAFVAEVESPFTLALDPFLAALFGQNTISGVAYRRSVYPSGSASLQRQFRQAVLTFNYSRGLSAGNGTYITSRTETAQAGLSYTGVRKLNLGVDGGYYVLTGIGQITQRYAQYSVGGGLTYNLGRALYMTMRYDLRDQQVDAVDYLQRGSRAAIGFNFSPGSLPLSLW